MNNVAVAEIAKGAALAVPIIAAGIVEAPLLLAACVCVSLVAVGGLLVLAGVSAAGKIVNPEPAS